MTGRGSDHEGDGGWPYRDIRGEQKAIERLRKIVPSEGQQVMTEVMAYKLYKEGQQSPTKTEVI